MKMKSSSRSSKRKAKRSQKRSKKKSRSSREKLKKVKRQDHSVSCSDDEDSMSYSSIGGDDSRDKKRGRSRDRKSKRDKKRSKRSSLVNESSGDDSPRVIKSKRLKKDRNSISGKKRREKKRRRGCSVSSMSSLSSSEQSYDSEREFEKKGRKVESKEKRRKEKGGKRHGKRRRDCSVSSMCSEGEYDREDKKVESNEQKGREKKSEQRGKKRRRDCSVSPMSSQSRSGSASKRYDDRKGELEKKNEKVESKEWMDRDKRSGSTMRKHMSRSCSPCSLHSAEASPKRLKSVIVFTKERDVLEEQEAIRDNMREDEIVCEFDDYPSKSYDSIDGVTGREAIPNLHDVSSRKSLLDESYRELVASDVNFSEVLEIQRQGVEGSDVRTPHSTAKDISTGNTKEVFPETSDSNCADLETILRHKALENLQKRHGKLSAKVPGHKKSGLDNDVKNPSIVKAQLIELHDEGNIKSLNNVGKNIEDEHMPHGDENVKYVQKVGKVVDDGKHTPRYDGNIKSDQNVRRGVHIDAVRNSINLPIHSGVETYPSKYSDAHLVNRNVETSHLAGKAKVSSNFVNRRPNVMSRNEFLGRKNTWKRQTDYQENLLASGETIVNDPTKQLTSRDTLPTLSVPQETISEDSNRDSSSPRFDSEISTEKHKTVGPSDPSPSGEQSTNDKMTETNEETQFQQKTMSVMRGGEMVQVSYKVYIPNKTPALARRKLKR